MKIDAFNYLRYGTIDGRLLRVSADASDPTAGTPAGAGGGQAQAAAAGAAPPPTYTAHIALARETLAVGGRLIRLIPGMQATIDIRTGERRTIEYLLHPVLRYKSESLRER